MRRRRSERGWSRGTALVLVAAAAALPGQDPLVHTGGEVVSLAEGGPLDRVSMFCLAEDGDGTLWIASAAGLFAYDGYRFHRFGTADGLPSDYVRCVTWTPAGELWVGTDRGAGVFDGTRFDDRGSGGRLAGPSVRRIVAEADGTLWFCCDQWPDRRVRAGLTRWREGEWKTYTTADGLPSDYVSDVVLTREGERFVLTRRGLARMVEERFVRPWQEAALPGADSYVWSLVDSPLHGLFAGATTGFFHRPPGGDWRRMGEPPPGVARPKLLAARDGAVLLLGERPEVAFLAWNGREFAAVVPAPRDHDGEAEYLLETGDGAIWAAGQGMLLRWARADGRWSRLSGPQPRLMDGEGRLWGTSGSGCWRLEDGRWQPVEDLDPPLRSDGGGGVWGASGDGLARWTNGGLLRVSPAELGLQRIACWSLDATGHLWVAGTRPDGSSAITRRGQPPLTLPAGWQPQRLIATSNYGVLCLAFDAGLESYALFRAAYSLSPIRLPEGVELYEAPQVCEDAEGRLWLSGFFGLYCREEGSWRPIEGLPGRHVTLVVHRGDELWVGCRGTTGGRNGLVCLQTDAPPREYPFTVHGVLGSDQNGTLYLSSSAGHVCVLPPSGPPRLLDLPAHTAARWAVPAGDSVWFATDRGAFRYRGDGMPPETVLRAAPAVLAGDSEILLDLEGRSRFRPVPSTEKFLVSTRVDGGPWSRFSVLAADPLRLPVPAVGSHTIEARLMDSDGDLDPTPVLWRLRVQAQPVQSQWWFWALVVLGLSAIGAATGMALRSRATERELVRRLAAEQRYRLLVEHSPYCIHELDPDGTLLSVNPAGLRMLGLERPEQVVGRHFTGAGAEAERDALTREFERVLQGATREFQFTSANGRTFRSFLAPLFGRRGEVVRLVGVSEDITDRLRLETQLQRARRLEAMGRLAGGVAHDFNNLLTAVLGNVGLARELAGESLERDPVLRDLLAEIEGAGQRAASLTRQLLAFARQQPVHPEVLEPARVLAGMRGLLGRLIPDSVHLQLHGSELGLRVRMDRTQLERVIMNLALNGAEAMPAGGVLSISLQETIVDEKTGRQAGLPAGRYALLVVEDQGRGMDSESVERVFEPFYSTKPFGAGTGLGLATVHGIVEQAGGHIEVDSKLGQGTRFSVYLPAAAEPAAAMPVPVAQRPEGGDETVLLCEDDEAIRVLLQSVLGRHGYQVLPAADAQEALRIEEGQRGPIHLLISDLVMPGMGGRDLAAEFRRRRPGAEVLFISGFAVEEPDPSEHLLAKPFSAADLLRQVRALLGSPAPTGGRPQAPGGRPS